TANDRVLVLEAAGTISFNGTVGSTAAGRLESLTTQGAATTEMGANINTDGNSITFVNAVVLTADSTITEFGAGNVSFQGAGDGDGNGPWNLTVNTPGGGDTVFQAIIGGTNALSSLATDADGTTSLGANVTTTGLQNYQDDVTLAGDVV